MATQKEVTTNKMTACKLCGQTVHFSDSIVSERTGKKIPLSEGTDYPHRCEQWEALHRRYYPSNNCNSEIYFDDIHLSKSGKHIPLNKTNGEPHQWQVSLV